MPEVTIKTEIVGDDFYITNKHERIEPDMERKASVHINRDAVDGQRYCRVFSDDGHGNGLELFHFIIPDGYIIEIPAFKKSNP